MTQTAQYFQGEAYYKCGAYWQHKGKRLHRAVWEAANGEIPKGYHVHHIDGNRSNNSLANLCIVEAHQHLQLHGKAPDRINRMMAYQIKGRDKARAWHSTDEGKAWHSQHAKETARNMQPMEYTCDQCGKTFQTKNRYHPGAPKFCSNNCKAAHRRDSGVDNVTVACERCGKEYTKNKYSNQRFCSPACARAQRWGDR